MDKITNLVAVRCECKPYCSDGDELELQKALMVSANRLQVELPADGEYTPVNERAISLAAVLVLAKYLSLTSEHEGDWQQSYSDLQKRIKALCAANDLPVDEFLPSEVTTIRDGSNLF